jgi:hypothetical protein
VELAWSRKGPKKDPPFDELTTMRSLEEEHPIVGMCTNRDACGDIPQCKINNTAVGFLAEILWTKMKYSKW